MRLTVGGNFIFYAGYARTPITDITMANIIINSTISIPGERYMCCDIRKIYLGTSLIWYEYIKLPIDILLEKIILEYKLMNLEHNGYVYCEIWKGMYGLPQAGIFANQKLSRRLEPKGYVPYNHTPGL